MCLLKCGMKELCWDWRYVLLYPVLLCLLLFITVSALRLKKQPEAVARTEMDFAKAASYWCFRRHLLGSGLLRSLPRFGTKVGIPLFLKVLTPYPNVFRIFYSPYSTCILGYVFILTPCTEPWEVIHRIKTPALSTS